MKKSFFTVALAVMCVLGLNSRSQAQKPDALIVTVPFDFVVLKANMPAGTYRVERLFNDAHAGVVFSGETAKAVVLPNTIEGSLHGESLTFENLDGRYFLRRIDTPVGVYTIPLPRMRMTVAQAHDQTAVPASGAN